MLPTVMRMVEGCMKRMSDKKPTMPNCMQAFQKVMIMSPSGLSAWTFKCWSVGALSKMVAKADMRVPYVAYDPPELGLGADWICGPELHSVQSGVGILLRGQMTADDMILVEPKNSLRNRRKK